VKQVAALVLDFDGVVVDSEAQNAVVLRSLLWEQFSVRLTDGDVAAVYGYPWKETFAALFQRHGIGVDPESVMPRLLAAKLRAVETDRPRTATGLADLLALPVAKAIVTGSFRAEVEATMRAVGLSLASVDAIVAADEVRRPKPHPDGYRRACEMLGIGPGDALALEDSRPGIASARAAGLTVAWVRELSHEDNAGVADLSFATLGEVAAWVPGRR
jgi:beta-phosphoglucomutase-like phosphatase (HAD superfamily)